MKCINISLNLSNNIKEHNIYDSLAKGYNEFMFHSQMRFYVMQLLATLGFMAAQLKLPFGEFSF